MRNGTVSKSKHKSREGTALSEHFSMVGVECSTLGRPWLPMIDDLQKLHVSCDGNSEIYAVYVHEGGEVRKLKLFLFALGDSGNLGIFVSLVKLMQSATSIYFLSQNET